MSTSAYFQGVPQSSYGSPLEVQVHIYAYTSTHIYIYIYMYTYPMYMYICTIYYMQYILCAYISLPHTYMDPLGNCFLGDYCRRSTRLDRNQGPESIPGKPEGSLLLEIEAAMWPPFHKSPATYVYTFICIVLYIYICMYDLRCIPQSSMLGWMGTHLNCQGLSASVVGLLLLKMSRILCFRPFLAPSLLCVPRRLS